DVAGTIRARGGIQFEDGSVLKSAKDASATPGVTAVTGNSPNPNDVSGTGTTNKLTKLADTTGGLTDTNMTEVGGNLGIGTTTPGDLIDIVGPANAASRTGL